VFSSSVDFKLKGVEGLYNWNCVDAI